MVMIYLKKQHGKETMFRAPYLH